MRNHYTSLWNIVTKNKVEPLIHLHAISGGVLMPAVMINKLRKHILGKKAKDSDAEARRIMLTAFMAITSFFAEFIFLLINLVSEVYYWVPANVSVMGICLLCLVLIRN